MSRWLIKAFVGDDLYGEVGTPREIYRLLKHKIITPDNPNFEKMIKKLVEDGEVASWLLQFTDVITPESPYYDIVLDSALEFQYPKSEK